MKDYLKDKMFTTLLVIWLIFLLISVIMFYDITQNGNTGIGIAGAIFPITTMLLYNPLLERYKTVKYLNSSLYMIDNMKGEEFEECLKAHFRKIGYIVKLTPKSHDYGADLLLKDNKNNYCVVQSKRYKGSVGIKSVQEVIGAREFYGGIRAIVITNSRFTKSAYDLARASGVELWDRDKLKEVFSIKDINETINKEEKPVEEQTQPIENENKKPVEEKVQEINVQELVLCPRCNSELVLRKGKYGQFYGCKAYPECRYTKNI